MQDVLLRSKNGHRRYNRGEVETRFWARILKSSGCWVWQGCRQYPGYGRMGLPGKKVEYAHRVSWTLHYGEIPVGLRVLHKCDNPPCARPDHLFLGTQADNLADMAAKCRGGTTSISRRTVLAIRRSTESLRIVGARYGVSSTAVSGIRRGIYRRHVK